jgi:dipeptidyl aminopeptidase/acylaminoacyl peptidase
MKRITRVLAAAAALACILAAQSAKTQGLPPLIDRELLFGNPEITAAQLSPDGKYIAFLQPWKDTRNIWVKKTEEPFSSARLLTTETKRPIPGYFWTRDGKFILYVKDNDGDENFNVFSVDPAAAAPAGADAPPSRDLTGLKGVRVEIFDVPKRDPDTVYIGLNDRDKAWHDLYKLTLSTGQRTLVRKNTERVAGWSFDLNGTLRLAFRVADNGDQEIMRVDPDGFKKIYGCTVFETCQPVRFHKDGKRAYMITNRGDDVDLSTLALLDPQTGKAENVESDPLKRVDFGDASFSEVTDDLAVTTYVDARARHYFRDRGFEADFKFLEAKFPRMEIDPVSSTKDERLWLVSVHSDTEPGQTILFDRNTKHITPQYRIREKLPREALSPMQSIHYASSDGLDIPAYLTLPKGLPGNNLPLMVVPHGGPWGRDNWGYSGLTQFLANRGYAVLSPNFRGSTGYGKKFLNAGNGEWGRKMQDDITWGVKHLISEGVADPKRVGIMGGSYGGYATLAGVAFTPDLYAAAVDIVGPSNLNTLLEAIPPYWESFRKILYARMADPGSAEGKAWLKDRSPLFSAGKIKTPLLVAQGANDPRVNRREAEQIVVALRDRGFPIEYLLAPDEGHGFARPVNNLALFMAVEKFLAKHLDGRYQEGGSLESVARLKEITVDPKTVVLSKKVDAASVGLPRIASALVPGTYNYKAEIAMGAQKIPLKVSTTIKGENGGWTVVDSTETPMGPMTETAVLDKDTLALTKRSVKQGPVAINVEYTDKKATGTMSMNGKDQAISADLDGALFADSAGAHECIAALPLAAGYSTAFRNFDLQKQKLKLMQLKVEGSESVTVPAGTFDAYRVEITSADGGADKTTLWIAKDSRKPLKVSEVLPQMGGATLTAELLP